MRVAAALRTKLQSVRDWCSHHSQEIAWAIVFAIPCAWVAAQIIAPPEPRPYKIYVVADPSTDQDTLKAFDEISKRSVTHPQLIGRVPIHVEVEVLRKGDAATAIAKASEIIGREDTLLVVGHMPSKLTEASLPTYFSASPPVPFIATTESDDDLLIRCPAFSCLSDGKRAPLLQLSPTNTDQGEAAVRFAVQHAKRHFLIIWKDDEDNDTYSKSLIQAYRDAINQNSSAGAMLVGTHMMGPPPSEADLKSWDPDCILYAGDLGVARTLINALGTRKPMLILSDSSVQPQLLDGQVAEFTNVEFTYQTDAADYNHHTNIYGQDAMAIARQLVDDLKNHGGDWKLFFKSLVNEQTVEDVRRNLVEVMRTNADSRSWYEGESEIPYIFRGHRRVGGMYHVWRLDPAATGRSEMLDVDGWHPPRPDRPPPIATAQLR